MLLRGGCRRDALSWRKEARQSSVEERGTILLNYGHRVEPPGLSSLRAVELPSLWSLGAVEPPGMSSLWVWAVERPGLCGVMILRTSACAF